MEMIDLERFKSRLQAFEQLDYVGDWNGFWRWKLKTETRNEHILDNNHRKETYRRLCHILPRWLTYRPYDSTLCLKVLENSLENVSDAYDHIRSFSLLEFDRIPSELLELIWHELGRAKEEGGNRGVFGLYYVVAITKPLMFLWGQTLAFDSIVRTHIPGQYNVSTHNRWRFKEWNRVMRTFHNYLRQKPGVVELFKKVSLEKYGTDLVVPYGQFLDLYYWVEGKEC